MEKNKTYQVTKKIKIHTQPLCEVVVCRKGKFVRETEYSYIFEEFRVSKKTCISIKETDD